MLERNSFFCHYKGFFFFLFLFYSDDCHFIFISRFTSATFFGRPFELRARRNSRNTCKINRDARNSLLLATGNMCCPFATLLGWFATGEMLD